MEEWKTYKLSEICTLINGRAYLLPELQDTGKYRIIRVGNLTGKDQWYYSDMELPADKYCVNGDLLFAWACTFGPYFWHGEKSIYHYHIWKMKLNQDLVDKTFLYFLLKDYVRLLEAQTNGSVMMHVTKSTMEKQNISLPSLPEQRRIANVLTSLDDKIELNRRINDNLEQQAQALYKSWFVDFEPFKDGKFVDSELGMIPEGWRVVSLGEITEECKEKVGNRIIKVLSPVTTGELVLSEEYFSKQVYSESIAKYIVVRPNTFAYNPARINIGSIGLNKFEHAGCVSPVYVVFETQPKYEHFFDIYRTTSAFKEEVISRSMGGVRQTLGYKDFSLIQIVYPPVSVIESFNTVYNTIYAQTRQLLCEIEEIAKLRDALLPKLMSGELKPDQINL